jgi:integrase
VTTTRIGTVRVEAWPDEPATLPIRDDELIPQSMGSRYSDPVWKFFDPEDESQSRDRRCQLQIDWDGYPAFAVVGERFSRVLRDYAYARLGYTRHFFSGQAVTRRPKPISVITEVRTVARFLGYAMLTRFGEGLVETHDASELCFDDLCEAARTYDGERIHSILVLKRLAAKRFCAYFGRSVDWKSQDIGTLEWRGQETEARAEPENRFVALPELYFGRISDRVIADVKQFLGALGEPAMDETAIGTDGPNWVLDTDPGFRERWDRFEPKPGRGQQGFKGLHARDRCLLEVARRARIAAEIATSLYTGARLSELTSLRPGCLAREGQNWVVHGTVKKHKPLVRRAHQDRWFAPPCLVDAIHALEALAKLTGSKYLFIGWNNSTLPYRHWRQYLGKYVDVEGRWSDWPVTAHVLRNTLALQFVLHEVGYPAISVQLHHTFDRLGTTINAITGTYGNIDQTLAVQAAIKARKRLIEEVFHPDARIAGPGAVQHKVFIRTLFAGLSANDVDLTLDAMAEREEAPFIDMGLNICTLGSKNAAEKTPCRGDRKDCEALECEHARILPKHTLNWKRRLEANERMRGDPAMAHAWPKLDEQIARDKAVVASMTSAAETDSSAEPV